MPVINVEDLTDKDKALMEVNQLKVEVKLERWKVSFYNVTKNDSKKDFNTSILIILDI